MPYPASTPLITKMNTIKGHLTKLTAYDAQSLGYRHFGAYNSGMNIFMKQGLQDLQLWLKEALCYIKFEGWSDCLHEEYPNTEKNSELHCFIINCIPGHETEFDNDLLMLIGY